MNPTKPETFGCRYFAGCERTVDGLIGFFMFMRNGDLNDGLVGMFVEICIKDNITIESNVK